MRQTPAETSHIDQTHPLAPLDAATFSTNHVLHSPRMRGTAQFLVTACFPALAACYVPVTHTPRVDPGLVMSGGYTLSLGRPDSGSARLPNPAALLGLSLGTRFGGGDWAPGLQVSNVLSVWNGVMLDTYLQMPKRVTGDLDLGAGANVVGESAYGPGYYVQAGRTLQNGYYIYTTQEVAFMRRDRPRTNATLWQPTFAVQRPSVDETRPPLRYFVTLTLGPTRHRCSPDGELGCIFQQPGSFVAIGMIASRTMLSRR